MAPRMVLVWLLAASTLATAESKSKVEAGRVVKVATVRPSAPAIEKETTPAGEYRIGPGDVLQIDVWKEPDASTASVIVRPDGMISARMVGEVPVGGLAPSEVARLLATRYAEFIRNPRVSVVVREMNSQKVYVIGEVKKEGAISLHGPLTVLQALAEAGGLSDYAKRKKINILRAGAPQRNLLRFDYDEVIRGEHMEQNIMLLPGDTIIVPR